MLRLSWTPVYTGVKGNELADVTVNQAATQQPREMRLASILYVLECIKSKWKPLKKLNKHIDNNKKSVTARYLQLKSGYAVTRVHLLRTKRVQDAECWWCNNSRQSVTHLMLHCQRWRRERDTVLKELQSAKIRNLARRDESGLQILFGDSTV
jgi:hypothetical protein